MSPSSTRTSISIRSTRYEKGKPRLNAHARSPCSRTLTLCPGRKHARGSVAFRIVEIHQGPQDVIGRIGQIRTLARQAMQEIRQGNGPGRRPFLPKSATPSLPPFASQPAAGRGRNATRSGARGAFPLRDVEGQSPVLAIVRDACRAFLRALASSVMAMHRVVSVSPRAGFTLHLTFDDGVAGTVDVAHLAGRGVFEIWNERQAFEAISIGDSGELRWGTSVDLCPDFLYLLLTGKKPREIFPALRREPPARA